MRNRVTFSYEPKYNYTYGIYEDTIFFSYLDEDIHRDNVRYTYAHDRATADLRSTVSISYTYINPIDHNIEIHDIDVYDRHIYKYVDSTFSGNISVDIKPLFENKLTQSIIVRIPTNSDVYVINSNNLNNTNLKKALTDKYGNVHTLIIYVHIVRLDNISHKTIPNEVTTFTDTSFTYANYYIPGYNNEYELGSYYCDDTIYNEEPDVYTDNTYLTTRDKDYIGGMSIKYNLPYQKLMAKVKYENNPYVIKLFNYTNQIIRNSYLYDPENNCFNISFLNAPEVNINLRGMEDRLLITDMESNHIGTTLLKIEFSYRGYHYEKISDITFSDLVNNVDQLVELEWVVNSDSTPKTRLLEGDILNYTYVNTDPMRANCKVLGYFGYHPFNKKHEAEVSRVNHSVKPLAWEYDGTYNIISLYDTHSSDVFEHNSYFAMWGVTNERRRYQSISSYVVPVDVKMFVNDIEKTEDTTYTYYNITNDIALNVSGQLFTIISYINPEYYNGLTNSSVTYINDNQISNNDLSNFFVDEDQTMITYYIEDSYYPRALGIGSHKYAVTTYNNDIKYERAHYIQSIYECTLDEINDENIYDLCRYSIVDILKAIRDDLRRIRRTDPNIAVLTELITEFGTLTDIGNTNIEIIFDNNNEQYSDYFLINGEEVDDYWIDYLYIDKLYDNEGYYKVKYPQFTLVLRNNAGIVYNFLLTLKVHLGQIDTCVKLTDMNNNVLSSNNILSWNNTNDTITYIYDYSQTFNTEYNSNIAAFTHYYDLPEGATSDIYIYDYLESELSNADIYDEYGTKLNSSTLLMNNFPSDSNWIGSTYIIYSYQYSNYKDINNHDADIKNYEYEISNVVEYDDMNKPKPFIRSIFIEDMSSAKASLNNIPEYIYLFSQFGIINNEYKNPWANIRCSDAQGATKFDMFDYSFDDNNDSELVVIEQNMDENEMRIGLNINNIESLNDTYNEVHIIFEYMNSVKHTYVRIINDLKFILPNDTISLYYIDRNVTYGDTDYYQNFVFNNTSLNIQSTSLNNLTGNNSVCNPSIFVSNNKLMFRINEISNGTNPPLYTLYNSNYKENIYIMYSNNIKLVKDTWLPDYYPYAIFNNDAITFDDPENIDTYFEIRTASGIENNGLCVYRLTKHVVIDIDNISNELSNNNGNIEIYTNGK